MEFIHITALQHHFHCTAELVGLLRVMLSGCTSHSDQLAKPKHIHLFVISAVQLKCMAEMLPSGFVGRK